MSSVVTAPFSRWFIYFGLLWACQSICVDFSCPGTLHQRAPLIDQKFINITFLYLLIYPVHRRFLPQKHINKTWKGQNSIQLRIYDKIIISYQHIYLNIYVNFFVQIKPTVLLSKLLHFPEFIKYKSLWLKVLYFVLNYKE